jgi:hypothetical protein
MDMQTKSAAVEIKTNSTPGEFTAVISAIGNVDRQGDVVMPGAFKSAIENDPIPPVYWAHKHELPPIGEGLDWREKGSEVEFDGRLFVGDSSYSHQYAEMVYAGMKSYGGRLPAIRQFSYTYGVPEGGAEFTELDGKRVRQLFEIRPVAEVGPCFIGANPETGLVTPAKSVEIAKLVAMKQDGVSFAEMNFFQLGQKAEWDTAYVDNLPDSAFLYVAPGGKRDSSGKTEPRSLRMFPYKNAQGQIDLPHLRDAISRAPQATSLSQDVRDRVQSRAQRLLRAQEGKAMLLSTIFSTKAWDDIDGWEISRLLEMLDAAVDFIQFEDDPGRVAQMQTISHTLLDMLGDEFDELVAEEAAEADVEAAAEAAGVDLGMDEASAPLVALGAFTKLYSASIGGKSAVATEETTAAGETAAETAAATAGESETTEASATEVDDSAAEKPEASAAGESESEAEVEAGSAEAVSEDGSAVSSDDASTVSNDEIARLVHTWPSH